MNFKTENTIIRKLVERGRISKDEVENLSKELDPEKKAYFEAFGKSDFTDVVYLLENDLITAEEAFTFQKVVALGGKVHAAG